MVNELQKKLGFWSAMAVGVGLVVASTTLVSLGQGMGIAGGGFVIAMVVAWLLQHFSAQTYAELSCMMPSAGGINSYTRIALGALPALVATISGLIIPNLLAAPSELAVAGSIISDTFTPGINSIFWGMFLLIGMIVLNLAGVDVFAKFQIIFTVTMIVTMSALGIIGLFEFGLTPPSLPEMAFNPLGWDVLGLTALAIWLYIGIEFVAPMAEETINPNKNIPRAMIAGLVIIFIVNLLYGFASIKYVSTEQLASSNAPHILVARAILGNNGALLIAIVSICASLSTLNTVIGVVPRILYGMGINRELPRFFGVLHRSFKTPAYGILFIGGMIGVFYLGGIAQASNLVIFILAACASWLISYIIAHIDLIVLRLRYPNAERPYRSPWFPIPQVIGILGMTYSLFNIAPVPEMASEIYKIAGIMIAGALTYAVIWLKFVYPAPLFKPISLEEAQKEWFYESQEVYDADDDFAAGELVKSEVPVNVNSKKQ